MIGSCATWDLNAGAMQIWVITSQGHRHNFKVECVTLLRCELPSCMSSGLFFLCWLIFLLAQSLTRRRALIKVKVAWPAARNVRRGLGDAGACTEELAAVAALWLLALQILVIEPQRSLRDELNDLLVSPHVVETSLKSTALASPLSLQPRSERLDAINAQEKDMQAK